MRLLETRVAESAGKWRLSGTVEYADGVREEYWFETPAQYHPTDSGNPWVAALLPLAVSTGEPLQIDHPVDIELLRGAESLVRIWKHWYPELHGIEVSAPNIQPAPSQKPQIASFFSAGVDSWFTVLRRPDAKHWITTLGFDFPLSKGDSFERHADRLGRIAEEHGAEHIRTATNLRTTRWAKAHWEKLAFGPALAAVALSMEQHFREVLLPSSCDVSALPPWGSHPLTDPLLQTSNLRLVHHGIAFTRFEKTAVLAESPNVLSELHVCYRGTDGKGQDETNCCRCEKCYRTMMTLEVLGKLSQATLFPRGIDLRLVRRIYCGTDIDAVFIKEIRDLAEQNGRIDLARAIESALRRSKMIRKLKPLTRLPGGWRLERWVLSDALT